MSQEIRLDQLDPPEEESTDTVTKPALFAVHQRLGWNHAFDGKVPV